MSDVQRSQSRTGHHRNASSKSGILKTLVSTKTRPASSEHTIAHAEQNPAIRPTAYSRNNSRGVLGERHGNAQSPPASPSKQRATLERSSKDGKGIKDSPKKSKSSTNLAGVFAKMNRSSKDLSTMVSKEKDKENSSPQRHSAQPATPIWAQYASTNNLHGSGAHGQQQSSKSSHNLQAEIDRYTPQEYSPSKQRNFQGGFDDPTSRPTLGIRSRPQSTYLAGADGILGAFGRRVSGGKSSFEARRSEESARKIKDSSKQVSAEASRLLSRQNTDRKTSGSSTEQAPAKEKLNVTKRGRVMAAVAALQGKNKETPPNKKEEKDDAPLNPKAIDAQFEAVLDARNIPEPMRQKMRSLTMRIKSDFIKQEQSASRSENASPPGTMSSAEKSRSPTKLVGETTKVPTKKEEDDGTSTKRSRTRSRTFTFSRGRREEKAEGSPSKKQRSQSRSRPTSIVIPSGNGSRTDLTPSTPTGSFGRKTAAPALPADYILYLRENQDPTKVEVGRLHKLRILLRNETVAWVDAFIAQNGMVEIVDLLKRTMALEWREDHEDQLLHETLLCLKGLCTTERAMLELNKFADDLFTTLLAMLFDEEKKGPAEYTTRAVIVNLLFNYLANETNSPATELEARARKVLTYLGEPQKAEGDRTVDFVLGMRVPRPYKSWSREVSNVTREVFWIFLHQLNVVPLPKLSSSHSGSAAGDEDREKVLEATYTRRHFPGSRPPVPAAPYIGGVEWDATTYLAAHLDLLNGIIASIRDKTARNTLREELEASGFEKVMGAVLRTCKEKFYSGVHDGLRVWVAAAQEDEWDTRFVREGPTEEEVVEQAMKAQNSPKKSPKKKADLPPKLDEPPKLDFGLNLSNGDGKADDDGWLG